MAESPVLLYHPGRIRTPGVLLSTWCAIEDARFLRQNDPHLSTTLGMASGTDLTAVSFDDSATDRSPKTHAALICGHKRLEQLAGNRRINPSTAVANASLDRSSIT